MLHPQCVTAPSAPRGWAWACPKDPTQGEEQGHMETTASEGTFQRLEQGQLGARVEENSHRVVSMGGGGLLQLSQ